MSTLWFAQRAERLCSVEHDPAWYELVNSKLTALGYGPTALEYSLRATNQDYVCFKADSNEFFDVLLVDGPWRSKCLAYHLGLVKPGGTIYLDNSDAESSTGEPGEIDQAVAAVLAHARTHRATVEWFTDFSPTCLFATQGLMVKMPS